MLQSFFWSSTIPEKPEFCDEANSMILYRKYHVTVFLLLCQQAQLRLGDEFYRADVLKAINWHHVF